MRSVLITGVSRGIGLALAQKFLSEGDLVLGTTQNGSSPLAHERLKVVELDLAQPKGIAKAAEQIVGLGQKFDIFINNAGVLLDEDATALSPEKLRRTLEVNLIGPADFTERLIPLLQTPGHIVNISSSAGSLGRFGEVTHYPNHYPAYRISKAALNMYSRTLAARLADSGIIVSAVHPGWVKTEMGGEEADLTPEEAAADIYNFALTQPPTGGFWFKGQPFVW